MRTKDCSKCPQKRNTKFPNEATQRIHFTFWNIGDTDEQRKYISTLVEEMPKSSTRTASAQRSRRSHSRLYIFFSLNKEKIGMFQAFF